MVADFKSVFPCGRTWSSYRDGFYFKMDKSDKISLRSAMQSSKHTMEQCDGLLIIAGAGMGVDSGLPDFRTSGNLWPQLKMTYEEMSDGNRFNTDPLLAWGLNFITTSSSFDPEQVFECHSSLFP